MFLALSLSFAQSASAHGPELMYGAPADAYLNTFPVMTIDRETGAFSDIFGILGPPFFNCSGGEVAIGSQFLYVSVPRGCQNQPSQIIGYSLDQTTGAATPIPGMPFIMRARATPNGMAAGPNGNVLYVADAQGYVDAFSVNQKTGGLRRLKGSPYSAGTTYELVVDPSGKFLYASDYDVPGGVFAFNINPDGSLTPVPGSPFLVPGPTGSDYQPVGIVDTGKYVYIALSNSNQIAGFSVNSTTGALTPLTGSPFATGNGPVFLARTGKYLYTENQLDGTISGFVIDERSGALTPVEGSPFGAVGISLTVDNTGRYLYLSSERGVHGYDIDRETGTLTEGEGAHGNDGSLWLTVVELPAQAKK
jgi:6-phosphogluconolactonase